MRVLADENMPGVEALFGDRAQAIERVPGRGLTRQALRDVEVLLVRSVTRVDRALLEGTGVRFVGTATIGTDHLDTRALAEQGICFANAPGSNADSVADYVIGALLHLARPRPQDLAGSTVGVLGVGNVGQRVATRLNALGLNVCLYDPPRVSALGLEAAAVVGLPYVSLAEALSCDILCCHTPLTHAGDWPTAGMLDTETLVRYLPDQAIVLNAGRGEVLPSRVIRGAMDERPDLRWVLDVWDPEPAIPLDLLPRVALATGHIAGYALDGKWRGTWQLRQALAHWLGEDDSLMPSLASCLPPAPALATDTQARGGPGDWQVLQELVDHAWSVADDDAGFRRFLAGPDPVGGFDQYRRDYPERREFSAFRVRGRAPAEPGLLAAAGFTL